MSRVEEYEILIFETPQGKEPFSEWFSSIRDEKTKRVILLRVQRMRLGLLGDCKQLSNMLHELRIDFGPGYRIYFAKTGRKVFSYLVGGIKALKGKTYLKQPNIF